MDFSPVNHQTKKVYSKHLTIEYKKPLCHSENNDNELKVKLKYGKRNFKYIQRNS